LIFLIKKMIQEIITIILMFISIHIHFQIKKESKIIKSKQKELLELKESKFLGSETKENKFFIINNLNKYKNLKTIRIKDFNFYNILLYKMNIKIGNSILFETMEIDFEEVKKLIVNDFNNRIKEYRLKGSEIFLKNINSIDGKNFEQLEENYNKIYEFIKKKYEKIIQKKKFIIEEKQGIEEKIKQINQEILKIPNKVIKVNKSNKK
jgi:hypothetical protein